MKYLIMSLAFFAVLSQIYTVTLDELENRVEDLEDGVIHVAKEHICSFPHAVKVLKKAMKAYEHLADKGSEEFEAFEALRNATDSLKGFRSVLDKFCEPEGPASREIDSEVAEVRSILEDFLEEEARRGGGKRTGRPRHPRSTTPVAP